MKHLALVALLVALATACANHRPALLPRNLNAILSENDADSAALEASILGFLSEAQLGSFSAKYVDLKQLEAHRFFFDGLGGFDLDSRSASYSPTVLKSYSHDGESYLVTVAFIGEAGGVPSLRKIIELRATPAGSGYQFSCPLEERTANLASTTIGDVTFHHRSPLDRSEALEFVRFRELFLPHCGSERTHLDYYCFEGLNELLSAYGFVFDATKCNFLAQDLGFLDHGGSRFVTGTGRADYIFGFVGDHLRDCCAQSDELYRPFVVGMSAYFGGYGLSGDSLDELKRQFRGALRSDPEMDFLVEFRKGRSASVHRHFSHYVMCAFLCQAVVEKHGVEGALRLAYSGPESEPFYEQLRALTGIDEANFHASIVALLGGPGEPRDGNDSGR